MIGIVINFDGEVGSILGSDNKKYLLLKKDVKVDCQLKQNDKVLFNPETFITVDITKYIARFVRLLGEKNE